MARWKQKTGLSAVASRRDSSHHSSRPQETGLKNYQLSYGAYGLHPTHQHNTPRSSWCTGQKQYYHTTSDSAPHESQGMKKNRYTKQWKTTKTQSTKQET